MLGIILCDDDQFILKIMQEQIDQILSEHRIDSRIVCMSSNYKYVLSSSAPDFSGYFSSCSNTALTAANSIDSDYTDYIKIKLTSDTVIYNQKQEYGTLNPYKIRNIYKLYDISRFQTVKKNSKIFVWYNGTEKQPTASVIIFTDEAASSESKESSQKSSFSGDHNSLTGTIEEINRTKQELNVNKIDSFESEDGSLVSTTTTVYVPVRYTENTEVTIRDVYGNGESYKDRASNIENFEKDQFASMKGTYKGGIFYAEKIMISIFHN